MHWLVIYTVIILIIAVSIPPSTQSLRWKRHRIERNIWSNKCWRSYNCSSLAHARVLSRYAITHAFKSPIFHSLGCLFLSFYHLPSLITKNINRQERRRWCPSPQIRTRRWRVCHSYLFLPAHCTIVQFFLLLCSVPGVVVVADDVYESHHARPW